MGQSASAYDEGDNYSDEEGDGSYYSSEYSDDEEGYESESSSVMSSRGPAGSDKHNGGDRRERYETHHRAQDASVADEQHRAQVTAAAAAAVDPANLEELSATELKDLVDELDISREDLIAASRAIRRGHHPSSAASGPAVDEPTAMGPASPSTSNSQGFYADDGHYAADVKVAMRILSASDHVRHLRFRLVPARLKEPIFWSSLLGILRYGKVWVMVAEEERLAEQQQNQHQHHHHQHSQEQQKQGSGTSGRTQHQNGGTATVGTAAASATSAIEIESLRRHIRQRDAEVAQLRRALEASKAKIRSLEKEVAEQSSAPKVKGPLSPSAAPLPSANAHKGEWVMDRDSQDFLALDEELKANLRGEKAKRLRDVREQMRFILDTDDVACSNGEWSCCKKKDYGCDGCAC